MILQRSPQHPEYSGTTYHGNFNRSMLIVLAISLMIAIAYGETIQPTWSSSNEFFTSQNWATFLESAVPLVLGLPSEQLRPHTVDLFRFAIAINKSGDIAKGENWIKKAFPNGGPVSDGVAATVKLLAGDAGSIAGVAKGFESLYPPWEEIAKLVKENGYAEHAKALNGLGVLRIGPGLPEVTAFPYLKAFADLAPSSRAVVAAMVAERAIPTGPLPPAFSLFQFNTLASHLYEQEPEVRYLDALLDVAKAYSRAMTAAGKKLAEPWPDGSLIHRAHAHKKYEDAIKFARGLVDLYPDSYLVYNWFVSAHAFTPNYAETTQVLRQGERKLPPTQRVALLEILFRSLPNEEMEKEVRMRLETADKNATDALTQLVAATALSFAVRKQVGAYTKEDAVKYYLKAFDRAAAGQEKAPGQVSVVMSWQAWNGLVENDPAKALDKCPELVDIHEKSQALDRLGVRRPTDPPSVLVEDLRRCVRHTNDYAKAISLCEGVVRKIPSLFPYLHPDLQAWRMIGGRLEEVVTEVFAELDPKDEADTLQKLRNCLSPWNPPREVYVKLGYAILGKAQTPRGFSIGVGALTNSLQDQSEAAQAETIFSLEPPYRKMLDKAQTWQEIRALSFSLPYMLIRVTGQKAMETLQRMFLDTLQHEVELLDTAQPAPTQDERKSLLRQVASEALQAVGLLRDYPRYETFRRLLQDFAAKVGP